MGAIWHCLFAVTICSCHWVWVAAILSLFRWPAPDVPTLLGLHAAFPLQRLLNAISAVWALITCRRLPRRSEISRTGLLIRYALVGSRYYRGVDSELSGIRLYIDRAAASKVKQGNEAYRGRAPEEAVAL